MTLLRNTAASIYGVLHHVMAVFTEDRRYCEIIVFSALKNVGQTADETAATGCFSIDFRYMNYENTVVDGKR